MIYTIKIKHYLEGPIARTIIPIQRPTDFNSWHQYIREQLINSK